MPDISYTIDIFICFFCNILFIFSSSIKKLPYLDVALVPKQSTPTSSSTVIPICSFFWLFGNYLAIFLLITIFGNRPWTPKTTRHHNHYPPIFPDFSVIFWPLLDRLPYLEIDPGPWKQPSIITTILQFFLIFRLFSCSFWIDYHIWKCALDPEINLISSPPSPIFSWFFGYFIAIFPLNKRTFAYLEIHPRPWKQPPNAYLEVRFWTLKTVSKLWETVSTKAGSREPSIGYLRD